MLAFLLILIKKLYHKGKNTVKGFLRFFLNIRALETLEMRYSCASKRSLGSLAIMAFSS